MRPNLGLVPSTNACEKFIFHVLWFHKNGVKCCESNVSSFCTFNFFIFFFSFCLLTWSSFSSAGLPITPLSAGGSDWWKHLCLFHFWCATLDKYIKFFVFFLQDQPLEWKKNKNIFQTDSCFRVDQNVKTSPHREVNSHLHMYLWVPAPVLSIILFALREAHFFQRYLSLMRSDK